MAVSDHPLDLTSIPLFPLPNVVLFPRAILPLHIFEERYKQMTADVLNGDRLIAMALLLAGWEKDYHQRPAIEPVVCLGQILTWEQLPDGNYNFLLQGLLRARVVREFAGLPYRLAELEPLAQQPAFEIDLEQDRARMAGLFSDGAMAHLPVSQQFRELLAGPMATQDVADLAAFNFLEDIGLKQQLLADADVRHRVSRTVHSLQECLSHINPGLYGFPVDPSAN